jgi:hypothetical protein
MLVIPKTNQENLDTAKHMFIEALNETKTVFLLFRSTSQNESQIKPKVEMAENYANNWKPTEYRVIWISNQELVKDIIQQYFGNDDNVMAVSLHFGTGNPRQVVKKYGMTDLNDNFDMGEAFVDAY